MAHIQKDTKHDFEILKFHRSSSYPQRIRCCENASSASENAENDQLFHDAGIQNFEVIYKEQVMAHIQNNSKHDFES
jgi:hypothetical protein